MILLAGDPRVASGQVAVVVHPSVSFLDLAFARLGIDPVATGVRIVDAERFAVDAAGERGPLLVAQCWSRQVLSDVKLSVEVAPETPVTVLHHLGLPDEAVRRGPLRGHRPVVRARSPDLAVDPRAGGTGGGRADGTR